MAWQSAPASTTNNANQNASQLYSGVTPLPPPPIGTWTFQAAPQAQALNLPGVKGYPIS